MVGGDSDASGQQQCLQVITPAKAKNLYLSYMKTTATNKNSSGHSSGAYVTKRVVVSSSSAAVRNAAERAIEKVGYVIKAKDGWVVREGKDGSIKKISKYKPAKSSRFAID